MRRNQRRTDDEVTWKFLTAASCYQVATSSADDEPVLGVLNGVVVGEWVFDVIVAPEWRRLGLGRRVVELLFEHLAVRIVVCRNWERRTRRASTRLLVSKLARQPAQDLRHRQWRGFHVVAKFS